MKTLFIIGLFAYGIAIVYANLKMSSYEGKHRKDN